MAQLKINRGTTYTIGLNYQRNGSASTLVGATVRFTIKSTEFSENTTDSDANLIKNVTDGNSSGEATITIDPADTATITPGKYYYDIKVEDAELRKSYVAKSKEKLKSLMLEDNYTKYVEMFEKVSKK